MNNKANWKLKLRYGKAKTPYTHFTIIADGIIENINSSKETAIMSMKIWATNTDEAVDILNIISEKIGFKTNGNIEIYITDAKEPPKDKPFGYDINFTPYNEN
jgi:hypothetical protein